MTDLLSQEQKRDQPLPDGWAMVSLQEFSDINPRFGKNELRESLEVTFLPMKCVEELSGNIDVSSFRQVSEVRKGYTPFQEEDVNFAKITPCMENGKIAVARDLKNGVGFGSSEFHVIRPHEAVSRDFLFYFLVRSDFRKDAERNMTGSAGQRRVPTNYIREAKVPFPPLNEQRRIVEKIEELFTKLDAGVRSLKQTRALLKSYRRSVLKAAVEGELSSEWREAHRDELEPASELLYRVLQERREKFTGKNYKEPASPDTSELPALPDGWVWAALPQLGELNRGKSKYRPRNASFLYGGPYPFVQTGDIREAEGTLRKYSQTHSEEGLNQSRLWPKRTLCITNAANIAETALLGFEACFPDSVVGFLPKSDHCNVSFVEYFMRTARENLDRYAPATAQKNINLQTLNSVAVPLPSLQEQLYIVEEIDRRLSVVDKLEATVEANLKQADALRQSILKGAFCGELVPQDPDDEPASVLLERIRSERQAAGKKSGKRKAMWDGAQGRLI